MDRYHPLSYDFTALIGLVPKHLRAVIHGDHPAFLDELGVSFLWNYTLSERRLSSRRRIEIQ